MKTKDSKGVTPHEAEAKAEASNYDYRGEAEVYKSLYKEEFERRCESIKKIVRLECRTEYLLALLWESRHTATIIN